MSECVKVVVRCRPMNSKEKGLKCAKIVKIDPSVLSVSISRPKILGSEIDAGKVYVERSAGDSGEFEPKTFSFDNVYDDDSNQKEVFEETALPLLQSVMEGYNGTIFAYGQTGCGKTFTMEGVRSVHELRGIIPTTFAHVFEAIDASAAPGRHFLVRASYIEIYNEEVRDLTSENPKARCELKEDKDKGVYIKGLIAQEVKSEAQLEDLMSRGNANRSVGATLMNADSSRSHSIFTITVECSEPDTDKGGDEVKIKQGKLNLVDLAGSERQSKTHAEGVRLKEATKINLSLSALGNVIEALVANASGKARHIPYRDSKLTRLLQDSLGGNTKTIMIAAISPADYNFDETLSTLRYANRAKNIKNKPKINEDPKDALLREYQGEIKRLKLILEEKGLGDLLSSISNLSMPIPMPPKKAVAALIDGKLEMDASPRSLLHSTLSSPSYSQAAKVTTALTGKPEEEREAATTELAEDLDRLENEKNHHERLAAVLEMELANRAVETVQLEAEKVAIQQRIDNEKAAGKTDVVALLQNEKARLEIEQAHQSEQNAIAKASLSAEKAEHEARAADLQSEMEVRLHEEASRRREVEDKLTFIKERTVKEKEILKNKLKLLQEKLLSGHERMKDIKSDQEEKIRRMKEKELVLRKHQANMEEEKRAREEKALFLEEKYTSTEMELIELRSKLTKLANRYRTLENEKTELEDALDLEREAHLSEAREADKDTKMYQQICALFLTSTNLDSIIKQAKWNDSRDEWILPHIDVPVVFPTMHSSFINQLSASPQISREQFADADPNQSHECAKSRWRRTVASPTFGTSGQHMNGNSSTILDQMKERVANIGHQPSYYRESGAFSGSEWKRSVLAGMTSEELEAMACDRTKTVVSPARQITAAEAAAQARAVSEQIDVITSSVKRREAFQGGKVEVGAEESKEIEINVQELDSLVKKRPAFTPARPLAIFTEKAAMHTLPSSAFQVPSRPAFQPASPLINSPLSPSSPGLNLDNLPKGRPAFVPGRVL